jgi:hypothetical protein
LKAGFETQAVCGDNNYSSGGRAKTVGFCFVSPTGLPLGDPASLLEENEMDEVLETPAESVPLDMLTKVYLKMRDKRAQMKRDFEAKDLEIEEQMKQIEEEMLDVCKKNSASSIRTEHGTIIRQVKSRYWTNDWDSMYRFIEDNRAFGLLEKRLHQTHMKEYLSENPDKLPMGLNVESEYTVVVRRSS